MLDKLKIDKKANSFLFFFNLEMNEIKCPECGSSINIDEDIYSNIIKQVRDQEFQDEISNRLEILENDKQKSIDIIDYHYSRMQKYIPQIYNYYPLLL